MADERGRVVVFNGEIYNWPELRSILESDGYDFSSGTDTEVILAAYDRWGVDFVNQMNGMWAIAIYDPHASGGAAIFLSRDRLGIKPLFLRELPGGIGFASEIGALLTATGENVRVDESELHRAFIHHRFDTSARTIYKGIVELEPGHSSFFHLTSLELKRWRYWSLPQTSDLDLNNDAALDQFTDLFEDAVRLRLRADVEVDMTLSGGVDSSAIAVATSRVGSNEVKAFTSHFPERPEIDESRWAKMVCDHLGFESVLVQPSLDSLVEDVPQLIRRQEAPVGGLSLYVHWAILREIRNGGTKVVLSGQGGDELFLGYERYYLSAVLGELPNIGGAIGSIIKGAENSRLSASELMAMLGYFSLPGLRAKRYERFGKKWFRFPEQAAIDMHPRMPVSRRALQEQELVHGQLRRLLRYDDRNSGALGMETRVPFVDHRLVEFGYRLPMRFKIRDGWTKWLLRQYLERAGLAEVAWRKAKLGFNAPTQEWTNTLMQARRAQLLDAPGRQFIVGSLVGSVPFPVYNLLELSKQMQWSL